MQKRPTLSVIVPNYDNAAYLADCLDSIIGQTYKDLEIVVCDDCSRDDSRRILAGYRERLPGLFQVILSDKNRGVAHTRHKAVGAARGEYITTLDSDDLYWDTGKLEKEMALIRHHRENGGHEVIAFSNILLVDAGKTPLRTMDSTEKIVQGMIFTPIVTRSCMIPLDFVMKRSIYFEVGAYDCDLVTHEDWDLKIRIAAHYPFYYTGVVGTAYRQHGRGLSSSAHFLRTDNLWRVFYKNTKGLPREERRQLYRGFQDFMTRRDRYFFKKAGETPTFQGDGKFAMGKVRRFYTRFMDSRVQRKWQTKIKRSF